MHRRGGLTCPPETQCARTNEIVHHPIHGNQNQVARGDWNSAERYFREGMLALPYRWLFVNLMAQAVEFLQRRYFFNSPIYYLLTL